MRRNTWFLLALALVLVALPLSAAGKQEAASGPVTLKWYGAGWEANKKAATLIERYNQKNTGVKIEYTELNNLVNDQFFQKYDTLIAAGEQCDLVYLQVSQILNRAINGAMLPINDQIKATGADFKKDYGDVSLSMFAIDGNVYGVPYAKNTFKVFYNKKMLADKGITIPENWTWAQFKDIATKLNDPAKAVYGAFLPLTWWELSYGLAEQGGWKMIVSENGKPKANFTDPIFRKAMEILYDMTMVSKINPDLGTAKAEKLNRRIYFADKKTPMIVDGYYSLIYLQGYQFDTEGSKPLDFEIGVAEFPRLDESTSKDVTHATLIGGFGMPKTAKHKLEAFNFARFLCNENIDFIGGIPALNGADISSVVKTFVNYTDKKGVAHANVYPESVVRAALSINKQDHLSFYKVDPVLYAKYGAVLDQLYSQQYELFFTGQQSLDDFINTLQKRATEEIAKLQ